MGGQASKDAKAKQEADKAAAEAKEKAASLHLLIALGPEEVGSGSPEEWHSFSLHASTARAIPDSLARLTSLTILIIEGCDNLSALPENIGELKKLTRLLIKSCPMLHVLPTSLGALDRLASLQIGQCSIGALPESFGDLGRLSQSLFLPPLS